MVETTVKPSEIEIVNPSHIVHTYVYPFKKNGVDNLGIVIKMTNGEDVFMKFINKDEAESSLREVYASIAHNQPLFVIQYQRDCCGEVIKSDKAVVGGMTLNTVQEALKNLKANK